MRRKKPLSYYRAQKYPFRVDVDDSGEYVVTFPDLQGCFTGSERLEDLPSMIKEGSSAWLEAMYESDLEMPAPTLIDYEELSGKFNLRVPKALHRNLSDHAEQEGVSLNQYVVALLARGDAQARIEQRLNDLEKALLGGGAGNIKVAEEKATYAPTPRRKAVARKATPATARGRSTKR
jgi:antitoxin HicB